MSNVTYVIKFNNGHCDETFATREEALAWITENVDNDEGEPHLSGEYCADTSDERRTGESVYSSQAECDADKNGGSELAVMYTIEAPEGDDVTITASISDGMSRNAGGEITITAETLTDAIEQAEEWVRAGSYTSPDSDTVSVSLVIAQDGEVIERRSVVADAAREVRS